MVDPNLTHAHHVLAFLPVVDSSVALHIAYDRGAVVQPDFVFAGFQRGIVK